MNNKDNNDSMTGDKNDAKMIIKEGKGVQQHEGQESSCSLGVKEQQIQASLQDHIGTEM